MTCASVPRSITRSIAQTSRLPILLGITMLGAGAGMVAAQTGITIADASASEAGTSGFGQMTFVVRVTRDTTAVAGTVSVQYQGASGTATVSSGQCGPGIDIVIQPSTLTVLANSNQGTIFATICEDALDEADAETFTLTLLSPSGATIQDGQATGTLFDDDPTPNLRVADASATEGGAGEQRTLSFTVSLSAPSGRVVSVNYAVAPASGAASATGGAGCGGAIDFVTRSGTETFPPGTATRQVAVTICGDAGFEANERIAMTLSGPSNASIGDGTGLGTITNDDQQPMVTVTFPNDGNLGEGTGAPQEVAVQVTLSNPNHNGASVTLARGGTAERGTACTGSVDIIGIGDQAVVTWAANTNQPKTVVFSICGDSRDEDNDTVELNVVAATTAGVSTGELTNAMVILDDDPTPAISVGDVTVVEGSDALVSISLSAASNRDVEVLLSTAEGASRIPIRTPATSGGSCGGKVDFVKTSHLIRILAGTLVPATPFRVTTCANADGSSTSVEVFRVLASGPTNASLARAVGQVQIREP